MTTVPKFLRKRAERLARYGFGIKELRGRPVNTPEFLVPVVKDFDRIGLGVAPRSVNSYIAEAVHFDGSSATEAALINNSLVAPNSGLFSFSVWFKAPHNDDGGQITQIFVTDPNGVYQNYLVHKFAAEDEFLFGLSDTPETGNVSRATETLAPDQWHHLLGSAQVNIAQPIMKIYADGVFSHDLAGDSTTGNSFVVTMDERVLNIGSDKFGSSTPVDMADLWIAPGVSLLDGNGDIPAETIAKFRDSSGRPVYLGESGELPTGSAPVVFFSGGAASFVDNKGTGGSFTLSGTLVDASSSPSD